MAKQKKYKMEEQEITKVLRKNLTRLNLSHNNLTTLPESLGQLTQLQTLNLSDNKLTALPESLGQLTKLQTLSLSGNILTTLPESLGQLTKLLTLNLSGNKLTTLPESLGQLTKLRSLDLSNNNLTALPESLGQLTELLALYLSGNKLMALPESLGQFIRVQILSLSNNKLRALPKSLGQLIRLPILDLSNNNLTALPVSLGQLTQLQTLSLSDNKLTALPESLGQLTKLRSLDLSNNKLRVLPRGLLNIRALNALFLHGNNALGIPDEVLGKTEYKVFPNKLSSTHPIKILDYYFSIRDVQGLPLRELKLLIVGRGGAGKTTLVKRLDHQPLDPTECETHGINISPLELECQDGPVTARVWDFGGQHVLHAMHEFFLTARSLYLIVLGEREDMAERDATYWLQIIRSYAGKAPVVIALNKSQGRSREMDRETLERNYGPIKAWVYTECAEGFDETIENLRTALSKTADEMPEIRALFPANGWKIKEWLENMNEPYIDFITYQKRCHEFGEPDSQQQEKLAVWMNDLGIAINYAEDERLHNTTVLRPDWLANGIYALLRANDSNHQQPLASDAILTTDRLGQIYEGAERLHMLNAADYPEDMWPFLLQLMKLFQLAFPLDDKGHKLLVPTLLPLEPPPNCEESEAKDRTRLRYEFEVVPGPLLPRLLVRLFSLIDNERRWRRGAILRYGRASARVWTTQDERWMYITAVGDMNDRNELITMLRVTILELFAEYAGLHVVEQWEDEGDWVPRRKLERERKLPIEDDREEVE